MDMVFASLSSQLPSLMGRDFRLMLKLRSSGGYDIVHGVNGQHFTTDARVQSHTSACGIYGRKSGNGM